MKHKPDKTKHLRTVRAFADALRVPRATVGSWVKRPDWPFPPRAPWPESLLPDVLKWAATLRGREADAINDGGDPDSVAGLKKRKLKAEVRKLNAQADQAETELAKTRGKLLDAAEVERVWSQAGVRIRNAFQNVPAQIVPLAMSHGMPGNAASAFQEQVTGIVSGILRTLSSEDESEE